MNPKSHHNPAPFRSHPSPYVEPDYRRAFVTKVIDGDTYQCLVDWGGHILRTEVIRLRGVDTPEIFGANAVPEGKVSRDRVAELIQGQPINLLDMERDRMTWGRFVADVEYRVDGLWHPLRVFIVDNNLGVEV